jgi:hypothetical protein
MQYGQGTERLSVGQKARPQVTMKDPENEASCCMLQLLAMALAQQEHV